MRSTIVLLSFFVFAGALASACIPPDGTDVAPEGAATSPVLLGRYTTLPATISQSPEPAYTPTSHQLVGAPARRAEPLLAPPEATALPTIAPTPTLNPLTGFQICTPLADILVEDLPRLISDGYHPPPVYYSDARHPAIDIAFYNWKGHRQISGTPVQSVLPGRVAAAEVDTFPMGNVVIVETRAEQIPDDVRAALDMTADQSLYILYAHMQEDSLRVSIDQSVSACQTLGQVGKTGNTLAAHLHLETRLGPAAVSFIGFQGYLEEATLQEKTNYRTWATSGQFLHFDPLRLLLFEIGVTSTPGRP